MPQLRDYFTEVIQQLWMRVADLGVFGYKHCLDPGILPLRSQHTCSRQVIISNLNLDASPLRDLMVVAHPYRYSSIPNYPSIEVWTLVEGQTSGASSFYRRVQYHTIRKSLRKPSRPLVGSFAVMPQLTSHFGHWVGDYLGGMIWYAKQLQSLPDPPRLLAISPSHEWDQFLIDICPENSLYLLSPQQFLEVNWVLQSAIVLPRLSPWQNLCLLRDCLSASLSSSEGPLPSVDGPRRIFLCSQRQERILNLEAVQDLFQDHGYSVLNPTSHSPKQLLRWIRLASSLWCEHGSMVMNVLLARDHPYRLLELSPLNSCRYPSELHMLGGGVYNSFHLGLIKPFYCQPAVDSVRLDRQLHPYQRQLVVDLDALSQELAREGRRVQ